MPLKTKALFIAFLLIGLSLIPVGDSAGKLLGIQGVDPLFIAWSRLAVGCVFVLPFSGISFKEIALLYNWRLLIRASLFSCAIFSMLTALKTEPIANVFGIFFIGPIVAYFLAGFLLKETITPARSLVLLAGFAAVLMVVKPGLDMGAGALLSLLAGTCFGCMLVCNRWLAGQFRPRLILLSTLLAGSLALSPLALPTIPTELDNNIITLVLVSSLASAIGNLIILQSSKHLEASVVAPFVYSQLIVATALGVILFDEWPDMISGIGLIIIFSSGVCSFFLNNKKN